MPDRALMPDRVHQPFVNRPSTGPVRPNPGLRLRVADRGSLLDEIRSEQVQDEAL